MDLTSSIPVLEDKPLCSHCAGAVLYAEGPPSDAQMFWVLDGDPRWWSEWLCNCHFCNTYDLGEAVQ